MDGARLLNRTHQTYVMALPPTLLHRYLGGSPAQIVNRLCSYKMIKEQVIAEPHEMIYQIGAFFEYERAHSQRQVGPNQTDRLVHVIAPFLNEFGLQFLVLERDCSQKDLNRLQAKLLEHSQHDNPSRFRIFVRKIKLLFS